MAKEWHNNKMSRDMTKPTKWLCVQRKLRSAWASAQSDQSLRSPHEESLGPSYPLSASEDADQTGRIWAYAGRTLILLVLSCHGSNALRYMHTCFIHHSVCVLQSRSAHSYLGSVERLSITELLHVFFFFFLHFSILEQHMKSDS